MAFTSAFIRLVRHIKRTIWRSRQHSYCLSDTLREQYGVHVSIHTACQTHSENNMAFTSAFILLVRHIKRTIWRSRLHSNYLSNTSREQYGIHVCIYTTCPIHEGKSLVFTSASTLLVQPIHEGKSMVLNSAHLCAILVEQGSYKVVTGWLQNGYKWV